MKSSPEGVSPGPRPTSCRQRFRTRRPHQLLGCAREHRQRRALRRRCQRAGPAIEPGSASRRSSGANPLGSAPAGAEACAPRATRHALVVVYGSTAGGRRRARWRPRKDRTAMPASRTVQRRAVEERRLPSGCTAHGIDGRGQRTQRMSVRNISQSLGQQRHQLPRRSRCCTLQCAREDAVHVPDCRAETMRQAAPAAMHASGVSHDAALRRERHAGAGKRVTDERIGSRADWHCQRALGVRHPAEDPALRLDHGQRGLLELREVGAHAIGQHHAFVSRGRWLRARWC